LEKISSFDNYTKDNSNDKKAIQIKTFKCKSGREKHDLKTKILRQ
jgi:hypothetical protein